MGRVVHFELPVDDPDRARSFYGEVFGWTFEGHGEVPYWLATTDDRDQPGIDGALAGRDDLHDVPVVVVNVDDLDATVERATASGAELLQPRLPVPGMGWTAYVRDPEGTVLGIWQTDERAR